MSRLSEMRALRLQKIQTLKDMGFDVYPARSHRTHKNQQIIEHFEYLDQKIVTVTGRLMSLRDHSHLMFADLVDATGKVQLYIKQDELRPTNVETQTLGYQHLSLLDPGDIVEGTGTVTKTARGEISILVSSIRLLTKSLRPLPDTWEGLTDPELIFRRRYLDLLLNPNHRELFERKAAFWKANREFLHAHGFIEVETPVLEHVTGGADARPFVTHMNALNQDFYLRISTELYQKRLIGGGFEKVFTIGPNFRNEGLSDEHLPEYTQVEWYWAYADYLDNMKLVEEMIKYIAHVVYGKTQFTKNGHTFDLGSTWEEISYPDIIRDRLGIDIFTDSDAIMEAKVKELGIKLDGPANRQRLIDNLWKSIRKTLSGPAFLINEPKFMSPLAKSKPEQPELTERFHVIIAGSELGNGYSELNDPLDQLDRFKDQQRARDTGDEEAQMLDIDFVEMLEYGMPPTSGYGHSERLFWFLENVTAREGTLFPQLKHKLEDTTKEIYGLKEPKVLPTQKEGVHTVVTHEPMTRQQAVELLESMVQNPGLRGHMKAMDIQMRGLWDYFSQTRKDEVPESQETWGLIGLLHDADWERTESTPDQHTLVTSERVREYNVPETFADSIRTHNAKRIAGQRTPETLMEWSLYASDHMSGIIVACALVMPEKKLRDVTAQRVLKKFKEKSFAKGATRDEILEGIKHLDIDLETLVRICLTSLQQEAQALGL